MPGMPDYQSSPALKYLYINNASIFRDQNKDVVVGSFTLDQ